MQEGSVRVEARGPDRPVSAAPHAGCRCSAYGIMGAGLHSLEARRATAHDQGSMEMVRDGDARDDPDALRRAGSLFAGRRKRAPKSERTRAPEPAASTVRFSDPREQFEHQVSIRPKSKRRRISDDDRSRRTATWALVFVFGAIGLVTLPGLFPYFNHQVKTCTVEDKTSKDITTIVATGDSDGSTRHDKSTLRRVHTTCGTFSVQNMLLAGDLNGAKDRYGKIRLNTTYEFEITGFQWGGDYPVIREATKVPADEQ